MANSEAMTSYFHRLNGFLDCPRALRRPFLRRTRQMAEDFVQEKPNAGVEDVADYLGDPRELAQGFLETLDPEVLERYHKRKKFLRRGLIVLMAAVILYLDIWVYDLWSRSLPVEVTRTIYVDD